MSDPTLKPCPFCGGMRREGGERMTATEERPTFSAMDVLSAIGKLRNDLNGYYGQLKAHNDLARHCENQRRRIVELEGLHAKAKTEMDETAMAFCKEHDRAEFLMRKNAKLRELVEYMHRCYVRGHDWGPYGAPEKQWVEEQMRELGIEVD